jgi:purine-binding chemotaxis protein CheW
MRKGEYETMQTTSNEKYVEITINQEKHAIGITEIHEIIKMQPVTSIPGASSYVIGMINFRGTVVPVINLRKRFGLPNKEYDKATRIVVVNRENGMVGLVVDSVSRVTTFRDIKPPPDGIESSGSSYFRGIGQTDEDLVIIIDLQNLLNNEK